MHRSTTSLRKDRHDSSLTLATMDSIPKSGRSVGQLFDLIAKIVRLGFHTTEFETRMRILPALIALSDDSSWHAHITLEQLWKCTIVLSTSVPFRSVEIGQTATTCK